jgi:type IV pilus assembly protein PilN
MIRVNLLPIRVSRRFEAVKNEVTIAGVLATAMLIGAGAFHLTVMSDVNEQEEFVITWRSKVGKKKKTLERVENLKAQTSEQEKKKGIIQGLKARKHGPVRMLDEIAKAAPEKLRLLEIDENKGQILLVGRATSNDVIAEFAHKLDQSIYFEEVYINASEQTMEDNVKVKEFSITARLMVVHNTTDG